MKIALIQMKVLSKQREQNIKHGLELLEQVQAGVEVAVLPEVWTTGYSLGKLSEQAETLTGELVMQLSTLARRKNMYIVAGSIAMNMAGKYFNTTLVFDNKGDIIGRYNKIHLFSLFAEEKIFAPGQERTVVDIAGVKSGLAICYDIRFPELARLMTLAGADVMIFPAVFSVSTGPDHWELLMRGRAVDNQVFVVGAAPANTAESACQAYGHSMVTDPWGKIIGSAGTEEEILIVELDLNRMYTVREQLPLLRHRRADVYEKYKK